MGPRFYFISLISTLVLAQAVMKATSTVAPTHEATTPEATTPKAPTSEVTTSEAPTSEITSPEAPTSKVTSPEAPTSEVTTPEAPTSKFTTSEAPTSEVKTSEAPTSEVTSSEAPTSKVTTSEAPTSEVTTSEAPTSEVTTSEVTTSEAPTSEVTTSEAPTSEVTTSEAPTSEVTTSEAPTSEVTTSEAPTSEVTTSEAPTSEVTTPEATTPQVTTPEPTTPEPIPIQTFGIFDGENKTYCIVLVGKLKFEIPFINKENQSISASIQVPIKNTVNGSCLYKDNEQQFILSFFDDTWNVSVIIQQSPKVWFARRRLLAETATYSWKHISLEYVIDENFPNAKDKGTRKNAKSTGKFDALQSKKGDSYKCEADQTIDIDEEGIKLVLSNFQYTAFAQQANKTFENEAVTECDADKKKDDNHVGAIVGGAVGGTVGLIIIVGIVMHCRNKRRKDYVVM